MASGFGALKYHNYRLFLGGWGVSQTGTWLQRTAQAWLVLDLTGSAAALGIVIALQTLPVTFLSLFGGVIADRIPKRQFIMVLLVGEIVQAGLFAYLVLANRIQVWEIYLLAVMLGIFASLEAPTRQSFVSEMVEPRDVQSAITLNSTVQNSARIVGPGIAGVIIAVWGTGMCFALNAVSFVAVVGSLLFMRPQLLHASRRGRPGAVVTQLGDGLRYILRSKHLLFPLVVLIFLGTFGYNFNVTLPLVARSALGIGSVGFGSLNMAIGVGALISAVGVATRVSPSPRNVLVSAAGFSALFLALGVSRWYLVSLGVLVCLGVLSVLYSALTNTLLQTHSREDYRGRVMSVYIFLIQGTSPLGGALTGWMAGAWGIQLAIGLEAAVCLAAVAGGFAYARSARAIAAAASPEY